MPCTDQLSPLRHTSVRAIASRIEPLLLDWTPLAGPCHRHENKLGTYVRLMSSSGEISSMAESTSIEWTDTTWNPVTGCTKISAGCDNCYAARFSERFRGVPGHPFENGFDLTIRPERLLQPLAWKKPRMIFVNSMSDLFHKSVPKEHISRVFDTMDCADWHIYQVLTKRSLLCRNSSTNAMKHASHPRTFGSASRSRMRRPPLVSRTCKRPRPPFVFSPWNRSSAR